MTQQWKPIASAPKDGSRVLIWHTDYCAPITAQWYGSEGWKMDSDVSPFWRQPTHWMPLPAAPCATCNDQGAVGDVLTAQPCPDCTPPASAQDDAKDERQAFEAWGMAGCEMVDDPQSGRFDIARHCAWEAWKARASVAAPAAGDARDAERYRTVRDCPTLAMSYGVFSGGSDLDTRVDAAIAASQQQEG
ncbi:hypothetical protein AXY46_03180 [Achromobacter xylosoxidans]|nr:hypothetical protein AXY46_03180 [Achromobacter xylosoxidans]